VTDGTDEMSDRPQKIIEAKLPLVWLLSSAFAVVFSLGGLYVQVNSQTAAIQNMQVAIDKRSERLDQLTVSVVTQQTRNEAQDILIVRNANDIADINRNLNESRQLKKWLLK